MSSVFERHPEYFSAEDLLHPVTLKERVRDHGQTELFPKAPRILRERARHFEGQVSYWRRMEATRPIANACGAEGFYQARTPWNVTRLECLELLIVGLMLQREKVIQKRDAQKSPALLSIPKKAAVRVRDLRRAA